MAETKVSNPFQRHGKDTGSPESQIRDLTKEIEMLQGHLKDHSKDFDAKRSLLKKVAKRRRFLKYIKKNDLDIYTKVSKKVGVRV
ncbi:MAG TPA: 30S ribosomal protein S15 [Candidatus Absconditabacterales bacterium]|nr:30S ribosomal protein S15 [Candidatus Absconditabacterales bacterium]